VPMFSMRVPSRPVLWVVLLVFLASLLPRPAMAGQKTGELMDIYGTVSHLPDAHTLSTAAHAKSGSTAVMLGKTIGNPAGKWCSFAVLATVLIYLIEGLAERNGAMGAINWKELRSSLYNGKFWGGVLGSLVGAWIAEALAATLPPAFRIPMVLASASVSWQIGSGNVAETDWSHLIVTTIGSMLTMSVAGAIMASPPGWALFLVGVVGYVLADCGISLYRKHSGSSESAPPPSEDGGPSGERELQIAVSGTGVGAIAADVSLAALADFFPAEPGGKSPEDVADSFEWLEPYLWEEFQERLREATPEMGVMQRLAPQSNGSGS